jgi:arylsulfatase A-like enzyme
VRQRASPSRHGQSLYQELTHGAFVMWDPKLIPTPRRVADPVQLIDLMPTVLDLLGLKVPDMVQGQSLAAFAKGGHFPLVHGNPQRIVTGAHAVAQVSEWIVLAEFLKVRPAALQIARAGGSRVNIRPPI